MATGIETLDALKTATAGVGAGEGAWPINPQDLKDLLKLTIADLEAKDYSRTNAEKLVQDIARGGVGELTRTMGVHFSVHPLALPLTGPKPTRAEREAHLSGLLRTSQGQSQVQSLFHSFRVPGTMGPIGALIIQTILNYEYGNGVQ